MTAAPRDFPRLVPFDPNRKPPENADMCFIDPPNFEEPENCASGWWILPLAVVVAVVCGLIWWGMR